MATVKELSDGGADGTRLGQSSADKVSFWGKTPIAQPLASTAGALTAGETTAANVAAALVDLRTQLVNAGIIRTS